MNSKLIAGSIVFLGGCVIFHGTVAHFDRLGDASLAGTLFAVVSWAIGLGLILWGCVSKTDTRAER